MFRSVLRLLAASIPLSLIGTAMAIGPDNQVVGGAIGSQWGGVVRILLNTNVGANTGSFNGTGTIIGNVNQQGQGWYCILTADHVVSTNGPGDPTAAGIGAVQMNSVGNGGDDGVAAWPVMSGYAIRTKSLFGAASAVDLALVAVNYGAYNAGNDIFVRNLVNDNSHRTFSIIGFGQEARRVATGYQGVGNYGTQRYENNVVNRYAPNFSNGGYTYDAVTSKIIFDPGTVFPGTGAAYDGDSGAPLFTSGVASEPGQGISYYAYDVFGVHQGGQGRGAGRQFRDYGMDQYHVWLGGTTGTHDGQNYISHINRVCGMVPEPSTLVALSLGALALLRRRRK